MIDFELLRMIGLASAANGFEQKPQNDEVSEILERHEHQPREMTQHGGPLGAMRKLLIATVKEKAPAKTPSALRAR